MANDPRSILLVEDERIHAELLRRALLSRFPDLQLHHAQTLGEARAILGQSAPELAIVDLELPDGRGTDLLAEVSGSFTLPVLIMTGQGDEAVAVEAIKAGALEYVVKSAATLADMPRIVERALREWRNIAERRRAEHALKESEQRFRSVFEFAPAGMAIVSNQGRVLQVNPAFCRLSGYSEAECLEKHVLEVTHPDDREGSRRLYEELRSGKLNHFDCEKRYLCKDGTVLWGRATVAGVYREDGDLAYCVAMVMNIDEHKQAEAKLQEAYRELDTFVSTVSHDLRLPLTPIIGYADFLRQEYSGSLDESALQILETIAAQGRRMTRIMEDLLTLSKLDRIDAPREAVDTGLVVRDTVKDLSEAIKAAGTTVAIAPLPAVFVPESFLHQVFSNLIGNAVNYAGRYSSLIEVGCESGEQSLRYFVRDRGPGIPESDLEKVFDQFYRCGDSAGTSGTGLGLAIVAKIARKFGGRAWAEQTPGGGATFWVEFPREPSVKAVNE
ncbi:hypothetical protein DESUT3_01990 [Desulfuromonas versatilis]|uniref:histidine kinase n=1 Tax=Desulfuromonas versatilis TaxID=2802975 RepID=A0ABN6DSK5_9BACT|nr:hybrid sensor histidine kinase/response regulator [Desulfuromonas versatilis]BCR03130.1 hypothetical protein DESUT3_01990 [Desulfuromonas versatilis]